MSKFKVGDIVYIDKENRDMPWYTEDFYEITSVSSFDVVSTKNLETNETRVFHTCYFVSGSSKLLEAFYDVNSEF